MAEISYLPGEGTVLVAGDVVVLVDAPGDAQICVALWRLASSGAGYARLQAFIESFGPSRLPDLGVACLTDEGIVVLLRGSVRASVLDDVMATEYVDERRRLYAEYGPLPASQVRLWLREPAAYALPLIGGVVRADAVHAALTTSAPAAAPPAAQEPPPAPVEAPVAAPPPPLAGVFVDRSAEPPQPTRPTPVTSLADVWVTPADPQPPVPEAEAAQPATMQPVQAQPVAAQPAPAQPVPTQPVQAQPVPTQPAPVAPAPVAIRPGPMVRAVLCPSAHPNAPDAPACRLCAAPIIDRDLTVLSRPPLGRLDFGALGWVPLDGDVLIGSDPGDQPAGGSRPVLITHPAVSARHVEFRVHEWTVTVTDLESQYGTSVALPGRTAQPLRGRYPAPIVPGTVVWLAQQVPVTYVAA